MAASVWAFSHPSVEDSHLQNRLIDQIRAHAVPPDGTDGAGISCISGSDIEALADQSEMLIREVEIQALKIGVTPSRYLRNLKSFTLDDQIRLLKARAAVVGLGGLGGHVSENLARAGVGTLVMVDGDCFEEHNLNRQIFSSRDNLGTAKAEAAALRLARVNPSVQLEAGKTFLSPANAAEIIAGCDVVVDCLDNILARFDLEEAAKRAGIPMVSAAVAGFTGHVTTVFTEDTGIELIYGARQHIGAPKGAETVLGCPPQTVSMVAAMESSEVLKVLTGRTTHLLRNKLWVVDLTDNTFEVLSLGTM